MAGRRRAQQIIAQWRGQPARRRGDRVCQRRMRFPLCESVEKGKCANQEIIPGRREPGTQSDQALNGIT